MQDFAIVILNWNGKKLLEAFLPKVIQYSANAKIYVIDNASSDESVEFLKKNFSCVKIIQNKENYGFAKGYNQGLKQVDAKYFCLLNSDVEVTAHWLDRVYEIFENQSEIGIIQPKILDFKNKDRFEYAGAAGGFIDKFGYPFCRGRIFDAVEKDLKQYNDESFIFWASGACFFVRKSVFDFLNGFDERFFAHQEEIDFCWRAFNQNIKTFYTSKSVIYHVGGATLSKSNSKKTFLNFRNSLLMLYKNLPSKNKFILLFVRLVLDGISGIRYLFLLQPNHCWAIIRSHIAFYSMLKFYKNNNENKSDYFFVKTIVWKHFIHGVSKFSQLK